MYVDWATIRTVAAVLSELGLIGAVYAACALRDVNIDA